MSYLQYFITIHTLPAIKKQSFDALILHILFRIVADLDEKACFFLQVDI